MYGHYKRKCTDTTKGNVRRLQKEMYGDYDESVLTLQKEMYGDYNGSVLTLQKEMHGHYNGGVLTLQRKCIDITNESLW
jgi:hypothetical protein